MLGTRSRRPPSAMNATPPGEDRSGATTATLYQECGQHAFAVARVLTPDPRAAEQIVVDAFTTIDGMPRCINAATERERVFARVVSGCEEARRSAGAHDHSGDDTAWGRLPWDHRVLLALMSGGRCSLDEVATILAADRTQTAQQLRAALHAVK